MKNYNSLFLRLYGRAIESIRNNYPKEHFSHEEAASSDVRTGYIDGKPVRRLVITFRSPGCSWTVRGGGCIMCGHYAGTTRGKLPSSENTVRQFENEILKYDLDNIEILSLYNSGSVLNPCEFNPDALKSIFSKIYGFKSIRKIILETRAEFVNDQYISNLKDIIGYNKILTIAMGLESSDDIIRNLCLNKGICAEQILDAMNIIKKYGETQLYVILGIPFLTEAENVSGTVDSIKWASTAGADEIHIEPMTLQKHTLTYLLAQSGLYKLPSIYSVYEVLKTVIPYVRPYVSPFMHMPLPEKIPSGCPLCTGRLIKGLLEKYNIARDISSLQYEPCLCIHEWEKEMRKIDPRAIEERIISASNMLEEKSSVC